MPYDRRSRLDRRNRIVAARYYYWTERRRRRFDDVVRILSEQEFFVNDRTILNIISACSDYLDTLNGDRDSLRRLRKEYPSWSWE
jgi:hypothetical protein